MLKSNAHQKDDTANPGTMADANKIIIALITKVKRPRVIKLIGSVKSKIKGLINIFKIPRTIATTVATQKLGIVTPADKIYPVTKTASAFNKSSIIMFILFRDRSRSSASPFS